MKNRRSSIESSEGKSRATRSTRTITSSRFSTSTRSPKATPSWCRRSRRPTSTSSATNRPRALGRALPRLCRAVLRGDGSDRVQRPPEQWERRPPGGVPRALPHHPALRARGARHRVESFRAREGDRGRAGARYSGGAFGRVSAAFDRDGGSAAKTQGFQRELRREARAGARSVHRDEKRINRAEGDRPLRSERRVEALPGNHRGSRGKGPKRSASRSRSEPLPSIASAPASLPEPRLRDIE